MISPDTPACISDRFFVYGDVVAALGEADLVVRGRFRFPRWSCTRSSGVVADWNAAEDRSPWANFTRSLHTVAAGALGLPA
jgi:2-furoyl-CoA dehydrogenase large subunit